MTDKNDSQEPRVSLGEALGGGMSTFLGMIAAEKYTATDAVEHVIKGDIDTGKAHLIHHIAVTTEGLARLIKDGTVAIAHLQKASSKYGAALVIPEVMFLEKPYTVWVYTAKAMKKKYGKTGYATITADGKVV